MRDIIERLRQTIAGVQPDRMSMICVSVGANVIADAIKEIQEMRVYCDELKLRQRQFLKAPKKKRKAA